MYILFKDFLMFSLSAFSSQSAGQQMSSPTIVLEANGVVLICGIFYSCIFKNYCAIMVIMCDQVIPNVLRIVIINVITTMKNVTILTIVSLTIVGIVLNSLSIVHSIESSLRSIESILCRINAIKSRLVLPPFTRLLEINSIGIFNHPVTSFL